MAPRLLSFPNPVNDVTARTVAGGVFVMALSTIASRQLWITIPLAYGFVARALSGPRFSPLAKFATIVVVPRLARYSKFVPGPPKRFAQTMGAAFSCTALGCWLSGNDLAAYVVLAVLLVPAALESALGYCVGCKMFAILMQMGMIPTSICEECADLYGAAALARRQSRASGL